MEPAVRLLIFSLVINLAIAGINTVNPFNTSITPNPDYGVSQVQTGSNCVVNVNGGSTCTPSGPSAASQLPNLLVFGDFLGGMISFVTVFGLGMVIPGYILSQFQVANIWIAVIAGAFWCVFFLLLILFRSGRYVMT